MLCSDLFAKMMMSLCYRDRVKLVTRELENKNMELLEISLSIID